jgi:hypothetical protein
VVNDWSIIESGKKHDSLNPQSTAQVW